MSLRNRPSLVLLASLVCLAPGASMAEQTGLEPTFTLVELRIGSEDLPKAGDYASEIARRVDEEGKFAVLPREEATKRLSASVIGVQSKLGPEARARVKATLEKGNGDLFAASPNFKRAAEQFKAAVLELRDLVEDRGADDGLRKSYLDALVLLATSHMLGGEEAPARDALREVVLSFGFDAKVTDNDYRPDVVELFKGVVAQLKPLKRGTLDVSTIPAAGATLMLNGRPHKTTRVQDLLPGTYRVRLFSQGQSSLVHVVTIDSGKAVALQVDIGFESHVWTRDGRLGLAYKDDAELRGRLPGDAGTIGRMLNLDYVGATGLTKSGENTTLHAFLVGVRKAAIVKEKVEAVRPDIFSKAAAKAAALALTAEAQQKKPAGAGGKQWYTSVPGWVAAGVGVIGLGLGIANLSYVMGKEVPASEYDSAKTNQKIGGAGLIIGALGLGAAGYFFATAASGGGDAALAPRLPVGERDPAACLPPQSFAYEPTRFSTH